MFRKRAAKNADDWVPVSIHIVEAKRPAPHRESHATTTFDAVRDLISDRRFGSEYKFLLEVRPEGGTPYRVEVEEKVPQRAVAPGLAIEEKIPNGIDLTGWVHVADPQDLRIDWTGYRATAEAKDAVQQARHVEADETYARKVLAKASQKQRDQLRAAGWSTVCSHAQAVREGAMTREEWEESAQSHLRRTLISPEQYEQAAAMIHNP